MEPNRESSIIGEELTVTPGLSHSITSATKWSRFIGIIMIVCLALLLAFAAFASTLILSLFENQLPAGSADMLGGALLFVVIFACLIGGVMIYFLMRFASLTKKGITLRNQAIFNDGLSALKIYFTIYGVISVIGLLFTVMGLMAAF